MREYLKKIREDNNLTQKDMADKLGISREYYSRIENGLRQKKLKTDIAYKISQTFNLSVDEIVKHEAEGDITMINMRITKEGE